MSKSIAIETVSVGGNSKGRTTNTRVCGYLRPLGADSGEYLVTSLSAHNAGRIWAEGIGMWRAATGDPYDMDAPGGTLPRVYDSRLDAASAVARAELLYAGERPTYFRYAPQH